MVQPSCMVRKVRTQSLNNHTSIHRLCITYTSVKLNYGKGSITESTSSFFFSVVLLQYLRFSQPPSWLGVLESIFKRIPRGSNNTWNFSNKMVFTVYKNKDTLKECFEKLQINRNQATVQAASGLLHTMTAKDFNFWLTFFHCIMPYVSVLYNQLQSHSANSTSIIMQ
jgi:hypothetical protein